LTENRTLPKIDSGPEKVRNNSDEKSTPQQENSSDTLTTLEFQITDQSACTSSSLEMKITSVDTDKISAERAINSIETDTIETNERAHHNEISRNADKKIRTPSNELSRSFKQIDSPVRKIKTVNNVTCTEINTFKEVALTPHKKDPATFFKSLISTKP
jgi:hypothetical protein